jgi:RNA polymerase sigma-70 factor, ECF subfamily
MCFFSTPGALPGTARCAASAVGSCQADDTSRDPEGALAAAALCAALLVVLQPAERLASVLHDLFAVRYEDIARIVDRSPAAARQLPSRARRRVHRAGRDAPTADRQIVDAFLAAALGGDRERLLAVPDPDVVLRTDGGCGASPIEGARGCRRARGLRGHARRASGDPSTVRPALSHRGGRAGRGARLYGRRRADRGDRCAGPTRLPRLDLEAVPARSTLATPARPPAGQRRGQTTSRRTERLICWAAGDCPSPA